MKPLTPLFLRNRQELEHFVVTHHVEGWSIRALARHLDVSRNMIRRILRKNLLERDQGHDALTSRPPKPRTPRASKLDPFRDRMQELLNKYPRITGQRMFEELREQGYPGSKTILQERLRTLRPQPKQEPIVRFETSPGKQGQMDWSGYTIPFKRTGKALVLCFSYILGFSRRHYIDFTPRRDFFTLIRRHQDAFEYYKGVPHHGLYDSEKTVVLRWEANRPVFNPAFVAFITHYQSRPVACQRGRPQTKGKIEAPFQYVEKNLLNGRDFEDLEDLRARARWWMREISDKHEHGTTGRPPIELFLEEEASALLPLPIHPYDCAEVSLCVCSLEGFVKFETNLYSVPYEYVVDILTLKATEHEILIYSPELERIACHERAPRGAGRKVENLDHRGSKKIRYGLESVQEAFVALGPEAESFLTGLKHKYPRNPGFHARAILRLKEHYHCDDIHRALAHAARYQAFDARQVERILKARAKPRDLESIRNEQARQHLETVLPPVRQRTLESYDHLLCGAANAPAREGDGDGEALGGDPPPSENPETPCPREGAGKGVDPSGPGEA